MERIQEIERWVKEGRYYKHTVEMGEAVSDIEYLLAENKRLREALEYYANLHDHFYHDAQVGELYEHWWARQSEVAIKALREEGK